MAENSDFICRGIADYLSARLDAPVELVNDIPWQERERLLDAGEIHLCWICGLPYIWKADRPDSPIELLAAPVMRGERYRQRPVYFSDIVVHRDSNFRSFADLRGAVWAYNEPHSHSGYNLIAYHLATQGESWGYFGRVIESGAHQVSLRMIFSGKVDASAIDSTVLELELRRSPEINSRLRVIETLGPSQIPPFVVLKSLPLGLREKLRELLLEMHLDPMGNSLLLRGPVARFVEVADSDYDGIREMALAAEQAV
ncbi:MAG TPA: PhnD/SsuA/transferrin family substrate-binding protein [Blastocatellia bacterium]|nr:PhnD/SsuA/transferrin family substrate-binding protein [Blastocatellia bacterium]